MSHISERKVLQKDDAWCLPWSRGEKVPSVKLDVPSKSMALGPIWYDA
jgi:hypothetical protein